MNQVYLFKGIKTFDVLLKLLVTSIFFGVPGINAIVIKGWQHEVLLRVKYDRSPYFPEFYDLENFGRYLYIGLKLVIYELLYSIPLIFFFVIFGIELIELIYEIIRFCVLSISSTADSKSVLNLSKISTSKIIVDLLIFFINSQLIRPMYKIAQIRYDESVENTFTSPQEIVKNYKLFISNFSIVSSTFTGLFLLEVGMYLIALLVFTFTIGYGILFLIPFILASGVYWPKAYKLGLMARKIGLEMRYRESDIVSNHKLLYGAELKDISKSINLKKENKFIYSLKEAFNSFGIIFILIFSAMPISGIIFESIRLYYIDKYSSCPNFVPFKSIQGGDSIKEYMNRYLWPSIYVFFSRLIFSIPFIVVLMIGDSVLIKILFESVLYFWKTIGDFNVNEFGVFIAAQFSFNLLREVVAIGLLGLLYWPIFELMTVEYVNSNFESIRETFFSFSSVFHGIKKIREHPIQIFTSHFTILFAASLIPFFTVLIVSLTFGVASLLLIVIEPILVFYLIVWMSGYILGNMTNELNAHNKND